MSELVDPHDIIPHGNYCYDYDEYGEFRICPYWSIDITKPYQNNGYCSFLGEGDWNGRVSLLWDQCKECAINLYEDIDDTD
jgi:hypothetical protein